MYNYCNFRNSIMRERQRLRKKAKVFWDKKKRPFTSSKDFLMFYWESYFFGGCLVTVLLEFPLPIVQRTDLARFEPAWDAVEVEGVLKGHKIQSPERINIFSRPLLTLHTPQATVHSSLVAEAWLAWHSMQRSMMWFRQIAQLSTTMSSCPERAKEKDIEVRSDQVHHQG